jgi:hypothetical protein
MNVEVKAKKAINAFNPSSFIIRRSVFGVQKELHRGLTPPEWLRLVRFRSFATAAVFGPY